MTTEHSHGTPADEPCFSSRTARSSTPVCSDSYSIWCEEARHYLSMNRPTKASLLRTCKARIHDENLGRAEAGEPLLVTPSRRRFEEIINSFDGFAVLAARHGHAHAVAVYGSQASENDMARLGSPVELDKFKSDLHALLARAGVWNALIVKAKKKFSFLRTRNPNQS